MEESVAIAKARGAFPLFNQTDYVEGKMIPVAGYYEIPKRYHSYDWDSLVEKIEKYGIRNSWTTTIAPTGTLSMISSHFKRSRTSFCTSFRKTGHCRKILLHK